MAEPCAPKYDALMVDAHPAGATQFDRLKALRDLAVPHIGTATHYVRPQGAGRFFVTTDPADTINHPYGHDKAGFPRYDWTEVAPGIKAGTLNG